MHEDFIGTMPVQEKHRFDVTSLDRYMREHVEGYRGPLEVEQFKGGQSNPTFRLTTPSERYVLRRKPPGKLLPSAHAVDREFRVISALYRAGIPVARAYALCQDESVIGTAFYIMAYVEGRVLWDQALPGMTPAQRRPIYDEMNRVIAALHRIDYNAVGLGDYGKPGNYLERQISRWIKQYRASETEKVEAMEKLIEWLPQHIPPGEEISVVHGDFRHGNFIVNSSGLAAVLDWEIAHLGDPMEDLGWLCVKAWRFGAPKPVGGFGDYDDLFAAYGAASGIEVDPEAVHWWEVLGTLKWGVICIMQASAHLGGFSRSVELAAIGRRVCEQEYDLLRLLP